MSKVKPPHRLTFIFILAFFFSSLNPNPFIKSQNLLPSSSSSFSLRRPAGNSVRKNHEGGIFHDHHDDGQPPTISDTLHNSIVHDKQQEDQHESTTNQERHHQQQVRNLIYGGNEAPYLPFFTAFSDCAGSLVSSQFVLTSAQCVDRLLDSPETATVTVTVGLYCVEDNNCGQDSETFEIDFDLVFKHPDYNSTQLTHDIALIKLKGSSTLDPAPLDLGGISLNYTPDEKTLMVAGE